jgi:hypothetical protein
MPPVRPADLVLASASEQPAFIPPSNKAFGPASQHGLLPQIITSGVDRAPTGALALAEGLSQPIFDDSELLARAAALTAPLPPMPIPDIAMSSPAAPAPTAVAVASPPKGEPGWVARTAAAAAEDLGQLFGGVFKRSAPAQTSPGELRASQQ